MGIGYNPSIITSGLVFAYDMNNTPKSWKGAPATNLAKTAVGVVDWTIGNLGQVVSRTTLIENERYRITSTSGTDTAFRMYFNLSNLINGQTYTLSYKYKILSGGPTFRANDWCDTVITRTTVDQGNGVFYETSTGTRATYDSTYRFMDFLISNNSQVEIWDLQLEQRSFATPYVISSSSRERTNAQAILDQTTKNTITANSLTYNANGSFSFNGSSNFITFPENSNLNSQTVTVEVWAKTNATSQNGFFFEKGNVNTQYSLFQEGSNIRWRANLGAGLVNMIDVDTATYINTTNWFHLAATFVSGQQFLYINGNLVGSNTLTGTIATNANGCSIGAYGGFNGSRGYYYNGDIGVVKVYNRALSASEVAQNFAALRGRYGI